MKKTKLLILIFFININSYSQDYTDCSPKLVLTKNGITINYKKNKNGFKVTWGKDSLTQETSKYYTCYIDSLGNIYNDLPRYNSETKSQIIFLQTINTSGSTYNSIPTEVKVILLPVNLNDSAIELNNFIAFLDHYIISSNLASTIYIYNLRNQKKQEITLYPNPLGSYKTLESAIKKIWIINNTFFIKYHAMDYLNGKDFITTKKHQININ